MADFKVKVETPKVPNFLRVKVGDSESTIACGDLDDRMLKALAKEWTDALLKNAERQRKEKQK